MNIYAGFNKLHWYWPPLECDSDEKTMQRLSDFKR